jgi:hypothetical protein
MEQHSGSRELLKIWIRKNKVFFKNQSIFSLMCDDQDIFLPEETSTNTPVSSF